jgi:hypothetical protein
MVKFYICCLLQGVVVGFLFSQKTPVIRGLIGLVVAFLLSAVVTEFPDDAQEFLWLFSRLMMAILVIRAIIKKYQSRSGYED